MSLFKEVPTRHEFNLEISFKERAVKLSIQRGNISQVAREVGVSDSLLSKWRKNFEEFGPNSFSGRGIERMTDEQREIKRLQATLKDKELDLEILKNAIAFLHKFCRHSA